MPASSSRFDVRLDVGVGESRSRRVPEADTPFRVAVLGDFSGRGSRRLVRTGRELAAQRPILVDRDNYDEVMASLDVQVRLPEAGDIRFRELEDFHPDRLYTEVPYFEKVRTAAQQLSSLPATRPSPPQRRPPIPAPGPESGSLLDRAVEATERGASGPPPGTRDNLRAWLDEQVAPHLEPRTSDRVADLRSVVADTAAAQMRALLHFPSFQQLEALWRAFDVLVRGVETSAILTIHLVDVSKQELIADLSGAADPHDSGIWRLLRESADETPFAVLLAAYRVRASEEDLHLLAGLG
ncbi:MAG: hypothetical protein GY953_12720, partial [bacterium]|nr:hypothetical protein [bacterium]